MSRERVGEFERLFGIEREAHAKVLSSLESVPVGDRGGEAYRRAVSILGHMAAARRIWLYRMGAIGSAPATLFPTDLTVDEVAAALREAEEAWALYFARVDDAAIGKTLEYQSLDAGGFRNKIEDILIQLHGHSLYHRGQIAMLVRQAGGEPARTDHIYWTRERTSGVG